MEYGRLVPRNELREAVQKIQLLRAQLAEAEAAYAHMLPKARFAERDAEIVRLRDEPIPGGKPRTFGMIRLQIIDRWPLQQNDLPLTDKAVGAAYARAKKALRQLQGD
jgi:hypothetical protein